VPSSSTTVFADGVATVTVTVCGLAAMAGLVGVDLFCRGIVNFKPVPEWC
jgi:hypothetical protein